MNVAQANDPNYIRHQKYLHAHPTDELVRIKKQNKVTIAKIVDTTKKRREDIVKKSQRKQEAQLTDVADYFLHNEVSSDREKKRIVNDIVRANS